MKLKCHVIGAHTTGDMLVITGQGKGEADAEWRGLGPIEIAVADTPKNNRAFYVGRQFELTIKPL